MTNIILCSLPRITGWRFVLIYVPLRMDTVHMQSVYIFTARLMCMTLLAGWSQALRPLRSGVMNLFELYYLPFMTETQPVMSKTDLSISLQEKLVSLAHYRRS